MNTDEKKYNNHILGELSDEKLDQILEEYGDSFSLERRRKIIDIITQKKISHEKSKLVIIITLISST